MVPFPVLDLALKLSCTHEADIETQKGFLILEERFGTWKLPFGGF
ncbi:MAG: hypothetical protein M2R45_00519 [Verrucomicrobia subdivision 3 bacterium]|nr:hypothetical protein [Limisphaerales bacterium]MCS1413603.1 hypothetical protein [Limisphaerales bacterium]